MTTITKDEMQLMLDALDKGAALMAETYGKEAKMSDREREAFRQSLQNGQDVPALILRMVCMGLECMFWRQRQHPQGIPQLLAKLEPICNYKRMGMMCI